MSARSAPMTEGELAPWRWQDGVGGLLTAAGLFALMLWLRPGLLQGWEQLVTLWSEATGLFPTGIQPVLAPPSTALLVGTSASLIVLYAWAGRWHERYHPLRVLVRALCLVQASACLYFAWAPARFPYAVDLHLRSLMLMGADFLTVMPWMLMLGWGLLNLPWSLRLGGSLLALGYFVLWVPHQVLLHAWVLAQGSVLFMPLLMLCLGPLLNGWIFVALYGWLVSLTPRLTPDRAIRHEGWR